MLVPPQTLEVARRAGADIEERLILIEACARVLPALEPATGSAMLMRLVSPLLHVLAKGLQSPGADENEVRLGKYVVRKCFCEKQVMGMLVGMLMGGSPGAPFRG